MDKQAASPASGHHGEALGREIGQNPRSQGEMV